MKNSIQLRRGFTLVEMLGVLTIIAILSVLAAPTFEGLIDGGQISKAGNTVAGIVDAARGEAIAKNTPTAVAVLTSGGDVAYRVFTILEYSPAVAPATSGSWLQASKWYVLPVGVDIDSSNTSFLAAHSPTASAGALPDLNYLGNTYSHASGGYSYFIILENGSIFHDNSGNPPTPCKLRMIPARGNIANNYYDIFVNDSTGHTKIVRP